MNNAPLTTLAEIQRVRNRLADPSSQSLSLNRALKTDLPNNTWNPFINHLMNMDDRFHLCPDLLDVNDMIAFEVNKEKILIVCGLPTIQHEIAHWVEMRDPKRWLLPNWNLDTHDGRMKVSARQFYAALSRETRVSAITVHLRTKEEMVDDRASLMSHIVWSNGPLPFGKFKTREEVQVWISDLFDRTYRAWNRDRIEVEFKIRLKAAQEFMETKEDLIVA